MADINIHIRVSKDMLRWGAVLFVMCAAVTDLSSESVTLTTYYPAPSGVYTNMITTGKTNLARDGDSVTIGVVAMPVEKLEIGGNIKASGHYKSDVDCGTPVSYPYSGWTYCAAGQYATYIPGVYVRDMLGATAAAGSVAGGRMFCCPR